MLDIVSDLFGEPLVSTPAPPLSLGMARSLKYWGYGEVTDAGVQVKKQEGSCSAFLFLGFGFSGGLRTAWVPLDHSTMNGRLNCHQSIAFASCQAILVDPRINQVVPQALLMSFLFSFGPLNCARSHFRCILKATSPPHRDQSTWILDDAGLRKQCGHVFHKAWPSLQPLNVSSAQYSTATALQGKVVSPLSQ